MDNVIIDVPERIEDDIDDFKLDCVDAEKNFTAAKITLCRDPENDKPLLFYSQELVRNFKNDADPFNKRHVIKVFTPSNIDAVADTTLERKFKDTILAHKPAIPDYSPLTDIHSQKMSLFMDDKTATFLEDRGIRTDGLAEDFQSIESVDANPFMEEVSMDAMRLKQHLRDLQGKYMLVKEQMAQEFEEFIDPKSVSDARFTELLSIQHVQDKYIKTYLSLKEQIKQLESKLDMVEAAVFSETSSKIKLPKLTEVNNGATEFRF